MANTIKKRPAAAMKRPASAPTCASYPLVPELPAAASSGDHVVPTFRQMFDIDLQEDVKAHARTVYLVTFSRVLDSTLQNSGHLRSVEDLSREEVRAALIDALENPDVNHVGGGRPREDEDGLTGFA